MNRSTRLPLVLSLTAYLAIATAALAQDKTVPPIPATPKKPVVDEYHGVKVTDDYRWLEDWSDAAVKAWSDAQNARARAILDQLPAVSEIRARLTELEMAASVDYFALTRHGETLFALKYQPPKQQPLLVVLRSADDPTGERTLVDPGELDKSGGTTIDWFVPSLDGQLVAVSLSSGGTESGTVHVYDEGTGKETGDVIPRAHGGTAGGSLAWTGDGSGFYYTRYPRGRERPEADMDFYQQCYYHKLTRPTEDDTYELGKDLPRIAEIALSTSRDGKFVLAGVQNGDGGEYMHFVRSASVGPGTWTQVSKFENEVGGAELGEDGNLYLLSRSGAPRGKLLRTPAAAPSLPKAELLIPESEASIEAFTVTRSRLYVVDQLGGPSQLRVFDLAGKPQKPVDLPPISSVGGVCPLEGDDILYRSQTHITPPAWFHYAAATGQSRKTALFRTSPADYSDCEVVRETATSKDGTQIPINIIRRKGCQLDGTHATIVYGYGGFGASEAPAFSARRRIFMDQGGVYAMAIIRGGGEFGEEWHRAGYLTKKQNVFDDFYAACQHMIDAGYTRRDKLAILGGSNGGLLMGATLTQHPDLCAAAVSSVGIYDMLRVETSANGQFNVTEYGTVKDPEQFQALYAYSPYHHVKDGTRYPAILFLTGANDPRVDPLQSRKMTARLQAADPAGMVLLRTSANTGHVGSSLKERIEQGVDMYAFIFAELGVKYEPAPNLK
jgi:prolyl oligopeptidase